MSVEKNEKDNKAEQRLHDIAQHAMDRSLDEIDGATLSRLRQARYNAIHQNERRHAAIFSRPALVSVFSVSALALALVLLSSHQNGEVTPLLASDDGLQQVDDFNLLANGGDPDLVNELEFYEWLEEQDDKGGLG